MKKSCQMDKLTATKLENVLRCALAKLDERGTDDSVTKAMSIVSATFEALSKGRHLTADEAYNRGVQNAACE